MRTFPIKMKCFIKGCYLGGVRTGFERKGDISVTILRLEENILI